MMIDPECEARAIFERAGFGLDDVPGARRLCSALLGARAIEKLPHWRLHGAMGELCEVPGGHRIYVDQRLAPVAASFTALHELAHWHLGLNAHGGPELESACDAIAGALTCPRAAFRSAVRDHGDSWEQLALDFGTDTSCVALRFGEVLDVSLALLAPGSVRVRGPEDASLAGDEERLRSLAKCRALPSGMRRERMPDDRRRLLIRVDAL